MPSRKTSTTHISKIANATPDVHSRGRRESTQRFTYAKTLRESLENLARMLESSGASVFSGGHAHDDER